MTPSLSLIVPPTPNDMLVLARESLACYALAMSSSFQLPPHLKRTIAHLEAIDRGEEPRSIIVMPPRHSKSETVSKLFPAWSLGRRPDLQIISIGYSQELADDVGRRVRNHIDDPRHEAIFPSSRLSSDSAAAHRFATTAGGNFFAIGRGGSITGRGADILIVDDLFKDGDEARSSNLRRSIRQWFAETVMTRLLPGAAVILVGTRWHSDDLIGSLLREHPDAGWKVLSFPAIAEHDESFRKEGDALWPEMYSLSYFEEQRALLGAAGFSALFQQRPVLEEGAIFKAEQFLFYEGEPAGLERIVLSFDTAFKSGADNDYSACTVWGEKANKYYLLYAWRGKLEYPELKKIVVALVRQWRSSATLVEDSASGQPLIQELKQDPELRIVPVRPTGDKISRAHSITPLIELGAVLLPGPNPMSGMFLEEHLAFPNGSHDDLVDTTTQALTYLRDTRTGGVTLAMVEAACGPSKTRETDPYRRAEMVELPEGFNPMQFRRRLG